MTYNLKIWVKFWGLGGSNWGFWVKMGWNP
jgi:hypothetical protein